MVSFLGGSQAQLLGSWGVNGVVHEPHTGKGLRVRGYGLEARGEGAGSVLGRGS